MSKLSLGTGCGPCSKSKLQNGQMVAWYLLGFYAIHVGFAIFCLSFQYQETRIVTISYILLIPSLLLCFSNGLLIYGIKRKIGWIIFLWFPISNVLLFGLTVGWMIYTYPSNWTLALLFLWLQHFYASFIVLSGLKEMDNDSFQNVSQAQPQIKIIKITPIDAIWN